MLQPPKQKVSDEAELQEYRRRKRKVIDSFNWFRPPPEKTPN